MRNAAATIFVSNFLLSIVSAHFCAHFQQSISSSIVVHFAIPRIICALMSYLIADGCYMPTIQNVFSTLYDRLNYYPNDVTFKRQFEVAVSILLHKKRQPLVQSEGAKIPLP